MDRREGQPVEPVGGVEHRLADMIELQVGLHLVHIEVVLRLAHHLGVVAIIPGLDREAALFGVDDLLHLGDVGADLRDGRPPHRHFELQRIVGGLRHRVSEVPVRVGRVAEQLGLLGAQLQDLAHHRVVVGHAAIVAARGPHPERLFAQAPIRRVGEEGLDRRARVGDAVLAGGQLVRLGILDIARDLRLGQADQLIFVGENERLLFLVGELVLAELGVERGELLIDLGQRQLVRRRQLRALLGEIVPDDPDKPLLLRVQLRLVGRVVDRVDAFEKLGVLRDLVPEPRDHRRQPGIDRLEFRRVHRALPDIVIGRQAIERLAGLLHRDDRVGEGRRGGVAGDRIDLLELHRHSLLQRGLEVGNLHLVEGGLAAIGAGPGLQQRVGDRGRHRRPLGLGGRRDCTSHDQPRTACAEYQRLHHMPRNSLCATRVTFPGSVWAGVLPM